MGKISTVFLTIKAHTSNKRGLTDISISLFANEKSIKDLKFTAAKTYGDKSFENCSLIVNGRILTDETLLNTLDSEIAILAVHPQGGLESFTPNKFFSTYQFESLQNDNPNLALKIAEITRSFRYSSIPPLEMDKYWQRLCIDDQKAWIEQANKSLAEKHSISFETLGGAHPIYDKTTGTSYTMSS